MPKQAGRQGREQVLPDADESVVVMNPEPMKAGNRLEGKTLGTPHLLRRGMIEQKTSCLRREEG